MSPCSRRRSISTRFSFTKVPFAELRSRIENDVPSNVMTACWREISSSCGPDVEPQVAADARDRAKAETLLGLLALDVTTRKARELGRRRHRHGPGSGSFISSMNGTRAARFGVEACVAVRVASSWPALARSRVNRFQSDGRSGVWRPCRSTLAPPHLDDVGLRPAVEDLDRPVRRDRGTPGRDPGATCPRSCIASADPGRSPSSRCARARRGPACASRAAAAAPWITRAAKAATDSSAPSNSNGFRPLRIS